MKIRLYGRHNNLGGGIHFSEFSKALRQLHVIGNAVEEVDATNIQELQAAVLATTPVDINIWFWPAPAIEFSKGINVCWAIFETTKLPNWYVNHLKKFANIIWVPSHWGRKVLIDNGINAKLIDVLPEGVDSKLFNPFHVKRPIEQIPTPFKFLTIGKFEERKGYRQLLQGFKEAFQNSNEAILLIKADYYLNHDEKKEELENLIDSYGLTNVQTYWGDWSRESMVELYSFADAFVFPSRAEGWGLPLIEAIACGLPVMSTFYSGHTEFLEHIRNKFLKIDFVMESISDPEFKQYWPASDGDHGAWANPDVFSIARNLKKMRSDYFIQAKIAQENSDIVRKEYSWSGSADRALRSLIDRGVFIFA